MTTPDDTNTPGVSVLWEQRTESLVVLALQVDGEDAPRLAFDVASSTPPQSDRRKP